MRVELHLAGVPMSPAITSILCENHRSVLQPFVYLPSFSNSNAFRYTLLAYKRDKQKVRDRNHSETLYTK